jgi:hypothetical protein
MKELPEMTIGELAAYICEFLNNNDIKCTLTGGACVSIYSENQYQSSDIDFIQYITYPRKKLVDLMKQIGFDEKNRYFVHKDVAWFIEFPSGPLAIGSEPIKDTINLEFSTGILRIISQTDCVKDRLAAFYFWDDKQALEQAKLVALNNQIDLKEIERWSLVENSLEKFIIFINYLKTK